MESALFERFIRLIELDQRLLHFSREREKLLSEQEKISQQVKTFTDQLKKEELKLRDQHKLVAALDLELATCDARVIQYKKKLEQAHSPKEFFSLEKELVVAQQERARLEEDLFKLWVVRDELQKGYEELLARSSEKIHASETQSITIQERLGYLDREISGYTLQRPTYVVGVPQELLEQYDQLKKRTPNPVVPLVNKSCSACVYALNANDLAEISGNKLVTCKDCFRLIYNPIPSTGES